MQYNMYCIWRLDWSVTGSWCWPVSSCRRRATTADWHSRRLCLLHVFTGKHSH